MSEILKSEQAIADHRLMDAMRKIGRDMRAYAGAVVIVDNDYLDAPLYAPIRIYTGGNTAFDLEEARELHRELGEALVAIEARFGGDHGEEAAEVREFLDGRWLHEKR